MEVIEQVEQSFQKALTGGKVVGTYWNVDFFHLVLLISETKPIIVLIKWETVGGTRATKCSQSEADHVADETTFHTILTLLENLDIYASRITGRLV